jgi:hypothetical protein
MAAKALKEPKDVNRGIHRIRGKLHFAYAQRILARLSDLDGGQCTDHTGAGTGRTGRLNARRARDSLLSSDCWVFGEAIRKEFMLAYACRVGSLKWRSGLVRFTQFWSVEGELRVES